jgi:hypothetical protein
MSNLPLPMPENPVYRVVSFGGGVQSHTIMALDVLEGRPSPYAAYVMADVGHDSEHPDTVEYIERYTKPFAAKHGINLVFAQKTTRGIGPETLLSFAYRTERSIPLPMYLMPNGAPGNRTCTTDFKVKVVDKWIKTTLGNVQAIVALGFTVDELRRARVIRWDNKYGKRNLGFWKRFEYPLIDRRLSRSHCATVLAKVGLPLPPRSACWFCPFQKREQWQALRDTHPDLWQAAIKLERAMNDKRRMLGRDDMYLHRDLKPLDAIPPLQATLFDDEDIGCNDSSCFT